MATDPLSITSDKELHDMGIGVGASDGSSDKGAFGCTREDMRSRAEKHQLSVSL